MSFWFDDSKTRGAADECHRQTVKENLSPYFGVLGIFEGTSFAPPNTPPACPAWGEGRIAPALQSTRTAVSASRES